MNRTQNILLIGLFAFVVLANIAQPYPEVAPLQHGPTLVLLGALPWLLRRWPLSDRSVALVVAFLALHTFGARWTYSNIPYDEWLNGLFGFTTADAFGWQRNHYDRLVHLCFGLLITPVIAEIWQRYFGASRRRSMLLAAEFILAISALYEVFEWMIALAMDAEGAEAYNGQQGDLWDAQKDIALAFVGSLIALAFIPRREPPRPVASGS